jgi:hypothetical protein
MQLIILPCSLTRRNAGINIAINNAMIAITTKSSIRVKPFLLPIITLLISKDTLPLSVLQDAQEQPFVPLIQHFYTTLARYYRMQYYTPNLNFLQD